MILSTISAIDGKTTRCHLGIVGAEIIFGANAWRDLIAQVVDIVGGRNEKYEEVFEAARQQALDALAEKARKRGANAVLNIRFDYQVLGEKNGMLMVAATGTAVILAMTKEEEAFEAARAAENQPIYLVEIEGRQRGPFSNAQLRALHAAGKIADGLATSTEAGGTGPTVREILSENPPG